MESGNGSASSKGVLVPVATSSDAFQSEILALLRSSCLYETSKQCFQYNSAYLVKNPAQEKKYKDFRTKKREVGYAEGDLKESYGFLLFDSASKAHALAEVGLLTGNSPCTTLGDPKKGVYISLYSDCLDLNRWHHGKSGYIAIIRLTRGRVKKVSENYTQNCTVPTEGFDCHMSEEFPSVSAKTSSFLAFERTQCYIYELLVEGSKETVQCPSAACPFAIVSFLYTDTKETVAAPQKESEQKQRASHYFPWRGQLQIGTHFLDVGLRSTQGVLIPVELPPVVKVDQAISMSDLRQRLPKTVFETYFSGEVFLHGLFCSLFELISSDVKQHKLLSQLLLEIKNKEVALTVPLRDSGCLLLLPSSLFLTYDGEISTKDDAAEILQGLFVFPDSRAVQRDTKFGHRKPALSSEVLRVLPALSYAEDKVEKTRVKPSEDLCGLLTLHMQNYAALINPGLASPSREVSIFTDQYDVPHVHKNLYSSREWTTEDWQNLKSYLSKPVSFQLRLSKASEILLAGQEDRVEDDDAYLLMSSEETPLNQVDFGPEDQLTGQKSAVRLETTLDSSTGAQFVSTAAPQSDAVKDLQPVGFKRNTEDSVLSRMTKTDLTGRKKTLTPSTSVDLPAELIVSFTSAERAIADARLINTKRDFQLSHFSKDKVNTMDDETVSPKKGLEGHRLNKSSKRKQKKVHKGHFKGQKRVTRTCEETSSLQEDDDNGRNEKECRGPGRTLLNKLSNIHSRKVRKNTLKKLLKNKEIRYFYATQKEKKSDRRQKGFGTSKPMNFEACPLQKKMERWDLKPVVSECGRILVPHGQDNGSDQVKALNDKIQSTREEAGAQRQSVDVSIDPRETVQSSTAQGTTLDGTVATTSKDGGDNAENVFIGRVNPEHSTLKQFGDEKDSLPLNPETGEHCSKESVKDSPSLEAFQENHAETPNPAKCVTKGDVLLNKLKTVLLRGKRKTAIPVSDEMAVTLQDTEPCLKKSTVDCHLGTQENTEEVSPVQQAGARTKEVSAMPSVDPHFAFALGLTPKGTLDETHKYEDLNTQQRNDTSDMQEQPTSGKQHQIIQSPQSIYPRRGRMKTLKKHQSISAELVKKNWWLHFQSPSSLESEKLKYNGCMKDDSDKKTAEEKRNGACSSTDALNLLADLALSATTYEQVLPQPDQAVARKRETSLKKQDPTKDATSGEPESVLHALLRQSTTRPIKPHESPSPSPVVAGRELVCLISKEHAYSLPPSSSSLLGLLGAPFHVSPLSGSTRLLHHHHTLDCGEIKLLHATVEQEDKDSEHQKKHKSRRKRFCRSRSFVNKGGSIQVTKQWKEAYNFDFDSKFTNDSKYRAVCRALHGPWDFSIQDTSEEVRLILHMWIGLFYSRSTPRFFHFDSNCLNTSLEESDDLKMPSRVVPAMAPCLNVGDTSDTLHLNALNLSKKDDSVLDLDCAVLDLSQRTARAEIVVDPQVNQRQTPVSVVHKEASGTRITLESLEVPQKASTFQDNTKSEYLTKTVTEKNDCMGTNERKRTCATLQKAGCLEYTAPLFKCSSTLFCAQEEIKSVFFKPERTQAVPRDDCVLLGCNDGKKAMSDGIKSSESTDCLFDKDMDSNNPLSGVVHTTPHWRIKSRKVENLDKGDKLVREVKPEFYLQRTHIGRFKDVKILGVKEKPVYEGSKVLPQQKICVSEFKDVEDRKKKERTAKDDSMEPSGVRADEVKEKPVKEDSVECSSKGIHADESKDKVILEVKEKPIPGGTKVVSPQRTRVGEFRDVEDLIKEERLVEKYDMKVSPKRSDAVSDLTSEKSGIVCNEDLLAIKVQSSGNDCKAILQGEVQNADGDCATQKGTEKNNANLTKEDGLGVKNADSVMTCDGLDPGKSDDFIDSPHQTPLDQQPTTLDEGKALSDLPPQVSNQNSASSANKSISEKNGGTSSDQKTSNDGPAVDKNVEVCTFVHLAHLCSELVPKSGIDATKCRGKAPLLEKAPQKEDISHDLPFEKLRAKGSGRTDQNAIPGEMHQAPSELKSVHGKSAAMENSEKTPLVSEIEKRNDKSTRLQETLYHKDCSTLRNDLTVLEAEVELSKGTDCKSNQTKKGLGMTNGPSVMSFTGIYPSCKNTVQPNELESETKMTEIKNQKETSIGETISPERVSPTQLCSVPLMSGLSLTHNATEKVNQPKVFEASDRCPTPTIDEEPYLACYGRASSKSKTATRFTGEETCKNITPVCLDKSSVLMDKNMPLGQQQKSVDNRDPKSHDHTNPDLELRTQGVVQSTDGLLHNLSDTENSSQVKTADTKYSLDQTSKAQETCVGRDFLSLRTIPTTEHLQTLRPNIDKDGHKTSEQTHVSHEVRLYSQRPVMAVKPSKSDEPQGTCVSKESLSKSSVMSECTESKPGKPLKDSFTTLDSVPVGKKRKRDTQESSSFSTHSRWPPKEGDGMSTSDSAKSSCPDPLYQHEIKDISKPNKIPSSLPLERSSKCDEDQSLLTDSLAKKVRQTTPENVELEQRNCSETSTSPADHINNGIIDDGLVLEPQSSLTCTIFNTSKNTPESFLELLSKRCLQDDLTQASMEQECLIFSEQMKQLLKRAKRGPIHQLEAHDKINVPCSSPMTVRFSNLEELEDAVEHFDAPSVVGTRIKVDMSDRENPADAAEKEDTVLPQKETNKPMAHAGVSGVTVECARLYTAMMSDLCAVDKVQSRPNHFTLDQGLPRTVISNHFDFCDQMKKEVDDGFCSSMNSVVRKFCKTKYRFFILATSDDVFFDETKAHLEAEGHTAVQPSEFFLGEDSSSTLLIILRNEDIVEHMREVPHLLQLKKSRGVRFAGVDEPDDVVNLTHQELFMTGGFIMLDRSTLDSLSLYDMKKMSEILQGLSRTGKWKWMLHYRDSRRLKENARLSAEGKKRKHFINWCQDVGILEVLPYHECDPLSRDQPDYLTCMIRLQVQNISSRHSVFVTDKATESAFGKNGILTFTLDSFLTCSLSETFSA